MDIKSRERLGLISLGGWWTLAVVVVFTQAAIFWLGLVVAALGLVALTARRFQRLAQPVWTARGTASSSSVVLDADDQGPMLLVGASHPHGRDGPLDLLAAVRNSPHQQ